MITLRRNCSSDQYLADDSLESNRFTTRKNIVAIGKFVQENGMSLTLLTSIFYLQKVGRDSRSLYGYLLSVIH